MQNRMVILLYTLVATAFLADWFAEDLALVPHALTFTTEAIIGLLFVAAFYRSRCWRALPTDAPLALLIVSGVAAAVIHDVGIMQIGLGLRALFRFVVLYYALVWLGLSARHWQRVAWLVAGFVLLQVPVALFQFAGLDRRDDQVFGTTRSTGTLVVLMLTGIAVAAGTAGRARRPYWPLLLGAGFFVVPAIAEMKAFYVLFPAVLLVVAWQLWREDARRALTVAAVLLVMFGVSVVGFSRVDGNADLVAVIGDLGSVAWRAANVGDGRSVRESTRRRGAVPRLTPLEDGGGRNPYDVAVAASNWPRLEAVADAYRRVSASPATWLFGFGLGSRTFTRAQVQDGTAAILYSSPAATHLYELGAMGVLLLAWLWLVPLRHWWVCRHDDGQIARGVIVALPAMALTYVAADFYTELLADAPGFTYWFLAAAVSARATAMMPDPAIAVQA